MNCREKKCRSQDSNLQDININVLPGNYSVKVITDDNVYIEGIVIR